MENIPPSPSPPPRLRRSPKRRALHERSDSNDTAPPRPTSPLGRSIRHVQQEDVAAQVDAESDLKVYATSPFPAHNTQRFAPPNQHVPGQGRTRGRPPTTTTIRSVVQDRVSRPSNTKQHQNASPPSSRRARARNTHRSSQTQYDRVGPRTPSPQAGRSSEQREQNPPSSAAAAASSSLSSPPWIVITPAHGTSGRSSRSSLDVDRRTMDLRPSEDNGYDQSSPTPPLSATRVQPVSPSNAFQSSPANDDEEEAGLIAREQPVSSSRQSLPAQPLGPFNPRQYHTPAPSNRFSLGAIASATPGQHLVAGSTPMTTSSGASSDTVVRQSHLGGRIPPSHFSLYPPGFPVESSSPIQTPPRRLERSSSEPAPRLVTMDISPASSGAPGSPVSPLSPIDQAFDQRAQNVYLDPSRTISDTALNTQSSDVRVPSHRPSTSVDATDPRFAQSSAAGSLFNRIASRATEAGIMHDLETQPRQFLAPRRNSPRVISVMSTIASEGTAEREDRSSGHASSSQLRGSRSSSAGPDLWGLSEQFPQTPRSLTSPQEYVEDEVQDHPTLPPRPESSLGHHRDAIPLAYYDKDLPSLPEVVTPEARGQAEQSTSLTRELGLNSESNDEPTELLPLAASSRPFSPITRFRSNRSSLGSFRRFRESLPAWARAYYRNEGHYRTTIGAQSLSPVHASPEPRRQTLGSLRRHQDSRPESLRMSHAQEQAVLVSINAQERRDQVQRSLTSQFSGFRPGMGRSYTPRSQQRSMPSPPRPMAPEPMERRSNSTSSTPRSTSPDPTWQSRRQSRFVDDLEVHTTEGPEPDTWSRRPLSDESAYSQLDSSGQKTDRRSTSDRQHHVSQRPVASREDYDEKHVVSPPEPGQDCRVQHLYAPGTRDPAVERTSQNAWSGSDDEHGAIPISLQVDRSTLESLSRPASHQAGSTVRDPRPTELHLDAPTPASGTQRRSNQDYGSIHQPEAGGPLTTQAIHHSRNISHPESQTYESSVIYLDPTSHHHSRQSSHRHSHSLPHSHVSRNSQWQSHSHSRRRLSDISHVPIERYQPHLDIRHPSDLNTDWSPHLWYNRQSTVMRRRTYIEPSIDEDLEGWRPTTRRNAQVWLFAFGFIFPLAWVVAAFLPLPAQPNASLPRNPGVARDLEKQLFPEDSRRFENARWWRNVNRAMVPVAVAIVVAVVVLVVVAARSGM